MGGTSDPVTAAAEWLARPLSDRIARPAIPTLRRQFPDLTIAEIIEAVAEAGEIKRAAEGGAS